MPQVPRRRQSRDQTWIPSATNRDRPNSRGDATRQLILATAEQLFAERGIAAVPLRDIGMAAGQKNNVAVQYHFGDRERLLREITAYRASESEKIRTEMLADLLARGRPPRVCDLVRAFIVPLASHLADGNHYLAFLSRYIIERGGYAGLDIPNAMSIGTLRSLLRRILPDHPEAVLDERWMIMMTCAVHTLARYQTATQIRQTSAPFCDLLDDLVNFLTAGIESSPRSSAEDSDVLDRFAGS